jgi:hypothetical protein
MIRPAIDAARAGAECECYRDDRIRSFGSSSQLERKEKSEMHLKEKIKEAAAAGYILLWLLGIPIPVLLLIFLLRGCT